MVFNTGLFQFKKQTAMSPYLFRI